MGTHAFSLISKGFVCVCGGGFFLNLTDAIIRGDLKMTSSDMVPKKEHGTGVDKKCRETKSPFMWELSDR